MGDRANVFVKDFQGNTGVYLYSHWGGSDLPVIVQRALARHERWDDNPYLARIIFCEMVKGDPSGTTGYGISSTVGDGHNRILVIDPQTQTVTVLGGATVSFDDYVAHPDPSWDLRPVTDPNSPLTAEQRRALFATFTEVFGQSGSQQRYAFTRMVLDKSGDEAVSWSSDKQGSLTIADASKVLDALNILNV